MKRIRAYLYDSLAGIENPLHVRGVQWGIATVLFFFFCSIPFVVAGLLPERFSWTASVIIALNAAVLLISELRQRSPRRAILLFVSLVAAGYAVEYLGVTTGFPFGTYRYTDVLGFRLFGVPVAIAFAWYVTVIASVRVAQWIHGTAPALRLAFSAALLTLALDIALEPMAAFVKSYWLWEENAVPARNYVSWFVLGFVGAAAVLAGERKQSGAIARGLTKTAALLLATQFALFALTDVAHGHILATLTALLFASIPFFSRMKHRWLFADEGLR